MPEQRIQSVVQIDPVFEKRLVDLRNQAEHEADARAAGGQVRWFRPEGWDGDVFDLAGFGPPYSRAASNQAYLAAVKDPLKPGTTGDLMATTTMIDFLAVLERGLRNRHTMRRPRATAHALARLRGHSHAAGPLARMLEHMREILRLAREASP